MGIGVLLLVGSLYIIGFRKGIVKESLFTDLVPEKALKWNNISYTQNDPDKGMRWILDAKEVKYFNNKTFLSFQDFLLKLEPQDRACVELEGKRADYDKNSGEIKLYGDLRGRTDNGYRIITDHMLYKEKEGNLTTDGPVKIFGPFFSVAGRGLYFNPDEEIIKIISDVTTLIDRDSQFL